MHTELSRWTMKIDFVYRNVFSLIWFAYLCWTQAIWIRNKMRGSNQNQSWFESPYQFTIWEQSMFSQYQKFFSRLKCMSIDMTILPSIYWRKWLISIRYLTLIHKWMYSNARWCWMVYRCGTRTLGARIITHHA